MWAWMRAGNLRMGLREEGPTSKGEWFDTFEFVSKNGNAALSGAVGMFTLLSSLSRYWRSAPGP